MELSDLPQISSPLPWHGQVWTQLHEQQSADQLPHAILLLGSQYTGKEQLALALSRALLCARTEGLYNCGHCHACELSASGGHGDLCWVEPVDKSKVIRINQIRDVVRFTNKTAGFGARKVIVLTPADSMNVNAFNALLKSLEEPAKDTYFILVCHRIYGVPATVRSRCQIVSLATPDKDTCLRWLDITTGNREDSEKVLGLAGGRPLLAQYIYHSGTAEQFAERRLGLEALLRGHLTAVQASALWSEREAGAFIEDIIGYLQGLSGSMSSEQLRSKQGKALFLLLDDVGRMQKIVSSGANPSKQLLIDAVLSKFLRELGAGLLGDNIRT